MSTAHIKQLEARIASLERRLQDVLEATGMDAAEQDRRRYRDAIASHDPALIKQYLIEKNGGARA